MNIQICINNQLADFDGSRFNLKSQLFDIYNENVGYTEKSYPLELEWTANNIKLFGYIKSINSVQTVAYTGQLIVNYIQVLKGKIRILDISRKSIKLIIEGIDWISTLEGLILDEVFTSSDNHTFNYTNVTGSWSGAANNYRYPMVNFGKTVRGTNQFDFHNFVPMWKIGLIIRRICEAAGITLNTGNWFENTGGQDMYVLAPYRNHNPENFYEDKVFVQRVTNLTDNQFSTSHPATLSIPVTLNKTNVAFDTWISGDVNIWLEASDRMIVPATGTYRLKVNVAAVCGHESLGSFTITSRSAQCDLVSVGLGTIATLTKTSGFVFDGTLIMTLDSGYVYLQKDDYVSVSVILTSTATNTGSTRTVTMSTQFASANMEVSCVSDKWSQYPGQYFTQNPSFYMPEISCLNFLKGLKQAYGLVFLYDSLSNSLNILRFNDFFGSNVIDWTNKQDYTEDIEMKIIASDFKEKVSLRYLPDTSDIIYNNAVQASGIPSKYDLTLTALSIQKGTDIKENSILSPVATSPYPSISYNIVIGINGQTLNPDYRPTSWNMRLLKWIGDTASLTWYMNLDYNGSTPTTKTVIPKAETPSMQDNYASFSKYYRAINSSKYLETVVILSPAEYQKFQIVVSNSANEGFRSLYKLNINGEDGYFYVQSIVFDGKRAKLELISK